MSLPKTFRQLAYIQSTGTQYIDTGVVPSFSNFEIKFTDFYVVSYLNTWDVFCGCETEDNATDTYELRRYRGNSTIISTFGKYNNDPYGSYRANVNTGTNVSEVRITNGVMYINGSQATATGLAHTQTTPTNTLYLFCRNTSAEAKRNSNFRFSRFEITKNNELVRDFIPVQRKSDNVLGLYDLVNDVFYTNDGTGTFTAGPVIYENGGINKVIYNNQVLIDITDTTATINDVAEGKVFYLADGTRAVGVRTT